MKIEHFPHMKELMIGFIIIGLVIGGLAGFDFQAPLETLLFAVVGALSGILLIQIIYLPDKLIPIYAVIWLGAMAAGVYFFKIWGAALVDVILIIVLWKYLVRFYHFWCEHLKEKNERKPADNPAYK